MMSVLEIYLSWVNSVLTEVGSHVDGVESLQDGKVLCELIDILTPGAGLHMQVKESGEYTPLAYINAAIEHMKRHEIKIKFTAEDIINSDVKSMLDVLWILILNYGIHFIEQNPHDRTIGIGKKNLLEWCQQELNTELDPSETLTFNLCSSNGFLKLLEKITHHEVQKSEDKSEYIDTLLGEIQDHYHIRRDIIKASDIVDGTVDEHTLMIYLSLLKRRKAQTLSRDSQKSQSAVLIQAVGDNLGASHSDREKSGSLNADLSVQTFGDNTSDWTATKSHFSEFENLSQEQDFSSKHLPPENESSSQIIHERVMQYLPRVSSYSNGGKEMESQVIGEKETDTLFEFSSISPTRDKHVHMIPSALQEKKHATQSTDVVNHNNEKSSASNANIKYNPITNASGTIPDRSQGLIYTRSNQSQSEQHGWRLPDDRYREHAREESVRIRIKRPQDYIKQWEDAIDRLSAVSVIDEFGSPKSPLISSYKTSLPSRSKSQEAGGSWKRNPTNANFERSNISLTRSKSSDPLPTSAVSSQDAHIHSSGGYPIQMHGSRKQTTSVEVSSSQKNYIDLVQENINTTEPEANFTSQRKQSQVSGEANGQTILKKRVRSEPPSSGSRVRFQQHTRVISHHQQIQTDEPISSSNSNMSHRAHSLSTTRQNISSRGLAGDQDSESDAIVSVTQTLRSPQLSMPSVRQPEADTKKYDSVGSLSSAASHLPRTGLQLNEDENALNFSHETDRIDYPQDTYKYSSRNISAERLLLNTALTEVSNLDHRWDLEKNYVAHHDESSRDSPPPIRGGGAGRVPRREAWEQERKQKEKVSVLDNQTTDMEAQSRTIEVLCKEIEVLKQKVEMLEEGDITGRLSRQSRSLKNAENETDHSISLATRNVLDYNSPIISAEKMKTLFQTTHERATSCPLLQPSRRSKATRSLSRSAAAAGSAQFKTLLNDPITTNFDYNNKSGSVTNDVYTTSSHRVYDAKQQMETDIGNINSAYIKSLEVRSKDLTTVGSLELHKIEKLISRRDLSEPEVTELKQALACAMVENDILQTKLSNARHEIHDKLKHTNGVLDDCRHHLAKAQAENMQLRTMFEQEKQKNEAYSSRIKEMEKNILEVRADNQHLESELHQATILLDQSPAHVDTLQAENSSLISRLSFVEHENDALREKVNILQHNQTKAMNTMDELRECLSRIRRERQEILDELTSFQRQDEANRIGQIINNYQEKGVQAKRETEKDGMDETEKNNFKPGSDSHYSPSCSYCSLSSRPSRNLNDTDQFPQRLSEHSHTDNLLTTAQQRSRNYEELHALDREIYPHRKGYIPHSRSCSPHEEGRFTSPAYYRSLSRDKSSFDQTVPEREHDTGREEHKLVESGIQYSQPRLYLSRSHDSPKTTRPGSYSPSRRLAKSSERMFKPPSVQYRLNRSFMSTEDLSSNPFPFTPELNISKGSFGHEEIYPAVLRSRSPSFIRRSEQDFPIRRDHSPPTRLSPRDKRTKSVTKIKRRPLHSKSEAGEIARKFQKEFDREDKMITSISKSRKMRWFEKQSESDGEDTGINSSMSSHSSCEHLYARHRTPILSEEQKRYADELIKKYTGKNPRKQTL